jgi:hypothetical protein
MEKLCDKGLSLNENIATDRIIHCTKAADLKKNELQATCIKLDVNGGIKSARYNYK